MIKKEQSSVKLYGKPLWHPAVGFTINFVLPASGSIHGKIGYNQYMASFRFREKHIADVITYIRLRFGIQAGSTTLEEINKVWQIGK